MKNAYLVTATLTVSAIAVAGMTNPKPNAEGVVADPSPFQKIEVTAVTAKGTPLKAKVAMLFGAAYDEFKDSLAVGESFTTRVLMTGGTLKVLGTKREEVAAAA